VDSLLLMPGSYRVNAALTRDGELLDHVENALLLHVEAGDFHGRAVSPRFSAADIHMPHRWLAPLSQDHP
jgi:lipopolysaccharide transport system ATP-binding protein